MCDIRTFSLWIGFGKRVLGKSASYGKLQQLTQRVSYLLTLRGVRAFLSYGPKARDIPAQGKQGSCQASAASEAGKASPWVRCRRSLCGLKAHDIHAGPGRISRAFSPLTFPSRLTQADASLAVTRYARFSQRAWPGLVYLGPLARKAENLLPALLPPRDMRMTIQKAKAAVD